MQGNEVGEHMSAVAYDFSVEHILPADETLNYRNCLNFIKKFENGFTDITQEDLHDILEQATKVIDDMARLTTIFEFLGAVEVGKTSRNDCEIMESFEGFENKLKEFEAFKNTVETVRTQIVRMMSRHDLQ